MDSIHEQLAEGSFVAVLLAAPEDVTTRLVYADWLDEHDRPVEAKYLWEIRKHKFIRRVKQYAGWALTPSWKLVEMPPRAIKDHYRSSGNQLLHPERMPARLKPWMLKIRKGWRMPGYMQHAGYYTRAQFFGVYVDGLFDTIDPLLEAMEPAHEDHRTDQAASG